MQFREAEDNQLFSDSDSYYFRAFSPLTFYTECHKQKLEKGEAGHAYLYVKTKGCIHMFMISAGTVKAISMLLHT